MANARISQIASRLEDVPAIAIYAAFLATRDERVSKKIQEYIVRINSITPAISGNDLKKRGIPPGPVYKRILGAIRDAWLDGKITNADQELVFFDELIINDLANNPSSQPG